MKFLILGLMLSFNVMAEGREGGGGTIEAMRSVESLSRENILSLVGKNGFLIKTEILTRIPDYTTLDDVTNTKAKEVYKKMISGKISLKDDFTYSPYNTDCSCPADKDMCTANESLAKVCFNVDKLVASRVNLSEFIGLLVHEHSHHYADELDHNNNYAIAKYFEAKSESKTLLGKKMNAFKQKNGKHIALRSTIYSEDMKQALLFCIAEGFNKVADYDVVQDIRRAKVNEYYSYEDTSGIGVLSEIYNGSEYFKVDDRRYIKTITCK